MLHNHLVSVHVCVYTKELMCLLSITLLSVCVSKGLLTSPPPPPPPKKGGGSICPWWESCACPCVYYLKRDGLSCLLELFLWPHMCVPVTIGTCEFSWSCVCVCVQSCPCTCTCTIDQETFIISTIEPWKLKIQIIHLSIQTCMEGSSATKLKYSEIFHVL